MRRLWVCVLLFVASSCRCKGGGVDPTELGFTVDPVELDFGRVLEGEGVEKSVSLTALGVSEIGVELATDAPFSVQPMVTVPGGASNQFSVKFTAGSIPATGQVRLSANGGTATVKLKGVGVRPKVCVPSAACKRSTYSLELDACVETAAPEGASCQPDSVCLEKGECRMSVCQGVARGCDDKDACTVDSCAMDLGCVHSARACPSPTQPCRIASCDSMTGCGQATAPDGTPCGTVDCIKALLCVGGACAEVPTPDGFICGPATPCQGESKCRSQVCVAPDAGVMKPRTVVRLAGTAVDERPAIVVNNGNVFFQLCQLPPPPDAGSDGGTDGGPDGGDDAGTPSDAGYCALASFTGTGFERWTAYYGDPIARRLIQVSPRGVVLLQPGALEVRLLSTGAPTLIPLEGQAVPRGIAQGAQLELWALVGSDAGTRLLRWGDGGLLPSVPLDAGVSLLAVDENGSAWLYSPEGGALGGLQASSDGGWSLQWRTPGVGVSSLTVSEGVVVAGGRHVLRTDDGGLLSYPWVSSSDAGLELLERPMVTGDGAGLAFYKECSSPVMSCLDADKATWVQAFSLADGAFLWRAQVLPEGVAGRVEEVALTGIKPGAVAALVQVSFDGGSQAFLEGFADGKRLLRCAMPEGTVLGGAVFTTGSLHILVTRDAGWLLESYDVGALPLLNQGWPQADGISGTRRAR